MIGDMPLEENLEERRPSGPLRCQARSEECGQCELKLGHEGKHLAGYLMWPALTNNCGGSPSNESAPHGSTTGEPEQTRVREAAKLLKDASLGLKVLYAIGKPRAYKTVGKVEVPSWGKPVMETCEALIEEIDTFLVQDVKWTNGEAYPAAPVPVDTPQGGLRFELAQGSIVALASKITDQYDTMVRDRIRMSDWQDCDDSEPMLMAVLVPKRLLAKAISDELEAALKADHAVSHRSQHETVVVDRATGERSTGGAAFRHGYDCVKVMHTRTGYLHDELDDRPYDIDNVTYCGRCHLAL